MARTLAWFSCGVASSVAALLSLEMYEDTEVLYCDTFAQEHSDNRRYFDDIQRWLGVEIKILRSREYTDVWDVWDVWERTKYLSGIHGARCTVELKKVPRFEYQYIDDLHVFGLTYDSNDRRRADRMVEQNPDMLVAFPLIECQLTKEDCKRIVEHAGIEIPMMYKLGYNNNNCIGCVKGGAGYWQRIRRDFPDTYWRMAELERRLGAAIVKVRGERTTLDMLPVDYLIDDSESFECGVVCGGN